ncbi:MATE family multidrug resistance protein [Rhodobacter aestuarii]|uniref:Multidrug-efflux transporter n=1 Tax=Rhodobacter aestuarii TaxID=453582 RepID=A0A1N7N8N4_9RHOB|nr:MATE family efflux transporter [Rhodobacter aestuarii]PTV96302.1 MATE family multidrug resistance protein [Rhodobacter aestuarii]SIS94700.1 multidrug resistance protein, MATE family [Rhodobacter aestuarii]
MNQTVKSPAVRSSGLAVNMRALLWLGLPMVGSNIAQMLLHVSDTIMLGWYGVPELAAVVLGSSFFFFLFILGSGFSYVLMGRISAAIGRDDPVQLRRDARMGLWIAIGYGCAVMPIMAAAEPILLALGQDPHLSALAQQYLSVAMWGMVPALVVAALRAYLSAQERAQAVMWATFWGVVVNVMANWAFIFGHFGAPEMGVRGAALASVMVQISTAGLLALYAAKHPKLRSVDLFGRFWRPDWQALFVLIRLGLPAGLTHLSEAGLFQASALMMGWIGTHELAAHGIALELASLTFMIHMGLSNAATVRVGHAYGASDTDRLRAVAKAALILSFAMAALTIAAFLGFPQQLVGLFIDNADPAAPAILAFGAKLLAVAALFQLFDAAQVMALGLLRGVHDTRVPMVVATVSYWLIGIPASYVLAFPLGLGGVGLWLGLVIGLACVGVTLIRRFWRGPWLVATA